MPRYRDLAGAEDEVVDVIDGTEEEARNYAYELCQDLIGSKVDAGWDVELVDSAQQEDS